MSQLKALVRLSHGHSVAKLFGGLRDSRRIQCHRLGRNPATNAFLLFLQCKLFECSKRHWTSHSAGAKVMCSPVLGGAPIAIGEGLMRHAITGSVMLAAAFGAGPICAQTAQPSPAEVERQ